MFQKIIDRFVPHDLFGLTLLILSLFITLFLATYFPLHSLTVLSAASLVQPAQTQPPGNTALPIPATAAVKASATLSSTTSLSSDTVTQAELLGVYKDLINANEQTLASTSKTFDHVLTLATIIVSIVALSLSGLAATGFLTLRNVNRALTSVDKALDKAEQVSGNLSRLEEDISADKRILQRLHTLAEIDQYAMDLFGDDSELRIAAKKGLLELSDNSDPIVRRECLRVFATMPQYVKDWKKHEDVLAQIMYLAEEDEQRGVRIEAEDAKAQWLSPNEKTDEA